LSDALLIVAALNGMRSRLECPKVPYTVDEIAREAKRSVDAGAGVIHLHARKEDGSPAFDLIYDDIVAAIRGKVDVPISITTQRTRQNSLGTVTALLDVLRDPPEIASVNIRQIAPDLPSHREEARQILEACLRGGEHPAPVLTTLDSLGDLEALYQDSLLAKAPYLTLSMASSQGTAELLAGTPANVLRLADAAQAEFSRFLWVAAGQDEASPIVTTTAIAAGGHVRVGFEDAATLPDGSQAASNAQLVEHAVAVARAVGRSVMEPDEVRALLR
jgi:3-keto-5-aminohexanoate cleavage enzyme